MQKKPNVYFRGECVGEVFPIGESGEGIIQDRTDDEGQECAWALRQRDYKDGTNFIAEKPRLIRRLTPVECERLQGFPDSYTQWGVVDARKGLLEVSDTQRYKCMGNSVTTSVISAIGSKLLEHIKECECVKANGVMEGKC